MIEDIQDKCKRLGGTLALVNKQELGRWASDLGVGLKGNGESDKKLHEELNTLNRVFVLNPSITF